MNDQIHRRELLRLGAAGGLAGFASELTAAPAAEEKPRPIRIGVIGVGSRGTYLLSLALAAGAEVPALCDIKPPHLSRAIDMVAKARDGRRPAGYPHGPTDYRRMLQRDDLEAVIIGTPMPLHGQMSIDALRAGKHVLSEVAAAMTLEESWGIVHAAEQTGRIYMLSENCCYWPQVMMILNMVRQGLFGELTFAECGYVHDCRGIMFEADGTLTWRGEMARDYQGNLYPTHALGPVAQWLGINRGDRMVSLVSASTKQASLQEYVRRRFPADHPARKIAFRHGDSVSTLIRTARGVLIDLRYDVNSARPVPTTVYYALQGTKASYESRIDSIWIDGRSKQYKWEPVSKYAQEFEHPLWTNWSKEAAGTGHGGGDFFVVNEFLRTVRTGGPSPIDAYDAAAWSSIIPLSAKSMAEGGAPQEIPDFTRGQWESRTA
ncbi:MAG: Gfo/Idh/MocA family protein [Thermoguttaceae bacterium]